MRIIAGIAGGRLLVGPDGMETRPPTGRMREAVFSSLGNAVGEASVVDLYAGTGSFGLEALSRGAASVTFIERNRRALRALRANVASIGLGGRVVAGDVAAVMHREETQYSLAFVDPPYALSSEVVDGVLGILSVLLEDGAIVVLHRRRDREPAALRGTLRLTNRRRYGDAEVWWYTKEAE